MPKRSGPRLTCYAIAILLLPLVSLWHQDDPLFSPLWQSDPWFYLGYFHNLVNFKRDLFPNFYYGSRLSWILPGYLAHRLLQPLAANALLHIGVHTLATASLFRILKSTAGVRAAFLTAILFSAYPWFWGATGWDHVTGAAIAYLMLGMACLTVHADSPSRQWPLTVAGASLSCAVFAHLFVAAFVPLILLYYAGMVWARRYALKRTLIEAAFRVGMGCLMVTVPLCLINGILIDGNFWFLSPSFRTAGAVMQKYIWTESIWYQNRLVPCLWLLIPSAAVAAGMLFRWRNAVRDRDLAGLMVSAQLLLSLAWMAAMQARGITLLGHYYYACYLYPFAFLVVGHSFWRVAERMRLATYLLACATAVLLTAASWYDPFSHPAPGEPAWLAAAGVALAASLALRRQQAGVFLGIAGFTVLMFATYDGANQSGRLHARHDEYRRVVNARARIELRRSDAPILFWYDRDEPAYHEYCALNASYLAEFARIGEHFPSGCPEHADKGTMVVVASWRPGAAEMARRSLEHCGNGTGLKTVVRESFAGSNGPHPYAVSLLGFETDYSGLRPLNAAFGALGKGVLHLAPDSLREAPLPLRLWKSVSGAVQSVTSEGVEVRTPDYRYAYALSYPPMDVPATGRYLFVLRYSLRSGQIAFGGFPADESRWLASVQSRHHFAKHGEAAFTLDLQSGDTVILRIANNNYDDHPSSFTIENALVFLAAPTR